MTSTFKNCSLELVVFSVDSGRLNDGRRILKQGFYYTTHGEESRLVGFILLLDFYVTLHKTQRRILFNCLINLVALKDLLKH